MRMVAIDSFMCVMDGREEFIINDVQLFVYIQKIKNNVNPIKTMEMETSQIGKNVTYGYVICACKKFLLNILLIHGTVAI